MNSSYRLFHCVFGCVTFVSTGVTSITVVSTGRRAQTDAAHLKKETINLHKRLFNHDLHELNETESER